MTEGRHGPKADRRVGREGVSGEDPRRPIDFHVPEEASGFAQGDPADAVFYIDRGQIKLTVVSERGKSAVVAMLGRGDFFGEGCLAGQTVRMATASVMTDASVVRIDKQVMMRLLHEKSTFSERFLAHLLGPQCAL